MNENKKVLPPMGFGEAVKKGFSNMFNAKGRTRRSEYWWYVLAVALICAVIVLVLGFTYGSMTVGEEAEHPTLYSIVLLVANILPTALLLSIQVRRMHDVGKTAVLPLCSFVSAILAAICYCYDNIVYLNNFANGQLPTENQSFTIALILSCVTVVLQLMILVYTLKDSQKVLNRYGESTKYVEQ